MTKDWLREAENSLADYEAPLDERSQYAIACIMLHEAKEEEHAEPPDNFDAFVTPGPPELPRYLPDWVHLVVLLVLFLFLVFLLWVST